MPETPIYKLLLGRKERNPLAQDLHEWLWWRHRLAGGDQDLSCLSEVKGRGANERTAKRLQARPICDAAAWLLWLGTVGNSQSRFPSSASSAFRVINLSYGDLTPFVDYLANQQDDWLASHPSSDQTPRPSFGDFDRDFGRESLAAVWTSQRKFHDDLARYLLRVAPYMQIAEEWRKEVREAAKDYVPPSYLPASHPVGEAIMRYWDMSAADPLHQIVRMLTATFLRHPEFHKAVEDLYWTEVDFLMWAVEEISRRYEYPLDVEHGLASSLVLLFRGSMLYREEHPRATEGLLTIRNDVEDGVGLLLKASELSPPTG